MTPSTDVTSIRASLSRRKNFVLSSPIQLDWYAFSFQSTNLSFAQWHAQASAKLAELLGFQPPESGPVQDPRQTSFTNLQIQVLRMAVRDDLPLPAYLLRPVQPRASSHLFRALHDHGKVRTVYR